jgi:dihydrofolate reductase
MTKARLSAIAAISRTTRALGYRNKLLWHIPEDMKRFKELTRNHPVIMGRKTFESIVSYLGTPLPDRTNIVITRQHEYSHPGVITAKTIDDALENARVFDFEEIFVGGGAEIYRHTLPRIDRLYLTLVDDEPEADTFFPEYHTHFPRVISREQSITPSGTHLEWQILER